MMANMPIFQDMAAGLLTATVKPAAAGEGEGVDFAALLAGVGPAVGTGDGEAPGQAVAAAKRPDFVNAMLDQRFGVAGDEITPSPTANPHLSTPDAEVQNPFVTAIVPDGTVAAPVSDVTAKQSAPAKFVQMASALPQMAMAMKSDAAVPVTTDTVSSKGEDAEPAEEDAHKAKAPAMQGLALPLLQGLNLPAGDSPPVASAMNAQAQPVANPSGGGVKIPGILPPWAAQPAQIHAQAGKQDTDSSLEPGAQPAGPRNAATRPANNRQALALEFAAESLGKDASPETVPGSAVGKAEKPSEAAALVPAPAPVAGVPVASTEMSGVKEIAAPLAVGITAIDTGAMLGEQVIDMGVDGQWIDRMAREIADISTGTGRASFTLNPENLGRLQVEILQRDEGADVRLIAETDEAATALSQGRQQLQQDARLQAVRIHDVQVERAPVERNQPEAGVFARGNASAQDMTGQQGQSQSFHKKPLMEAVSTRATGQEQDQAASERTRSQRARYA